MRRALSPCSAFTSCNRHRRVQARRPVACTIRLAAQLVSPGMLCRSGARVRPLAAWISRLSEDPLRACWSSDGIHCALATGKEGWVGVWRGGSGGRYGCQLRFIQGCQVQEQPEPDKKPHASRDGPPLPAVWIVRSGISCSVPRHYRNNEENAFSAPFRGKENSSLVVFSPLSPWVTTLIFILALSLSRACSLSHAKTSELPACLSVLEHILQTLSSRKSFQ